MTTSTRKQSSSSDATPAGHLTLLVTKTGKSYGGDDFSRRFRKWCDDAGLPPECSFHGLRKAALTRLANAGCTAHEIAAISGHKTLREVQRYTAAADQARLARRWRALEPHRKMMPIRRLTRDGLRKRSDERPKKIAHKLSYLSFAALC
jgi:integrase